MNVHHVHPHTPPLNTHTFAHPARNSPLRSRCMKARGCAWRSWKAVWPVMQTATKCPSTSSNSIHIQAASSIDNVHTLRCITNMQVRDWSQSVCRWLYTTLTCTSASQGKPVADEHYSWWGDQESELVGKTYNCGFFAIWKSIAKWQM